MYSNKAYYEGDSMDKIRPSGGSIMSELKDILIQISFVEGN